MRPVRGREGLGEGPPLRDGWGQGQETPSSEGLRGCLGKGMHRGQEGEEVIPG